MSRKTCGDVTVLYLDQWNSVIGNSVWSLEASEASGIIKKTTFFLEPVVQSEVTQKEKNKYCILMPDEPICKVAKEKQTIMNRPVDTAGEREGGTNG